MAAIKSNDSCHPVLMSIVYSLMPKTKKNIPVRCPSHIEICKH